MKSIGQDLPQLGYDSLPQLPQTHRCGKLGPQTGRPCTRYAGHEQPPSSLLGPDFHEAINDGSGPEASGAGRVFERWSVTEDEIPDDRRFLARITGGRAADRSAESRERCPLCGGRGHERDDRTCRHCDGVGFKDDPNPGPEPATNKAVELAVARAALNSAGLRCVDGWKRTTGNPSAYVAYEEWAPPVGVPIELRIQYLFGEVKSWCLRVASAEDLQRLREILR